MTCAMVLFVCLGTPAGYISARVYKSFGGEKWKSNVLLTSMLCPGIVFAHFFVMNLVLWYVHKFLMIWEFVWKKLPMFLSIF